jgi:hypothetical protein
MSAPQATCGARKLTVTAAGRWICTERPGHEGNHEATGTDGAILMAWPRDDELDAILTGDTYRIPAAEVTR